MTEDQIEREVERRFDGLDARLMRGDLSQAEYDRESRLIDRWAAGQYTLRAQDNDPQWVRRVFFSSKV